MSGFKRLFWALSLLWALFWLVVYPLHEQWTGQQVAFDSYNKTNKMCDAALAQHPEDEILKGCHQMARENLENTLNTYSFKRFWLLPVALWPFFLLIVVIPPAVVFGLAALAVWVRNGLKQRPKYS